jgi:hypothetical protein
MSSSAVMPVMAGGNLNLKPKMTTETTEMHKNIKIVKIDSTLKNVTPYWIIIAAGSVEEGKLATFKYIDISTILTEEERLKLKKFVKELWKKYRVKTINNGDVTLITLDSGEVMNPTREKEAILVNITQAVNEYFRKNMSKIKMKMWARSGMWIPIRA